MVAPSLRCPRNGQRTSFASSPHSTQPLGALNKRLGRRFGAFRQPGYRPTWWPRPACEGRARLCRLIAGGEAGAGSLLM